MTLARPDSGRTSEVERLGMNYSKWEASPSWQQGVRLAAEVESSLTPGDSPPCTLCLGEGNPLPANPSLISWWGLYLTHVLASVLAGLLWGQFADQQGLQELAHEILVTVEGAEGILGSRRGGGDLMTSTSACALAHGVQGSSAETLCASHLGTIRACHERPKCSLSPHLWADPSVHGSHCGATCVSA